MFPSRRYGVTKGSFNVLWSFYFSRLSTIWSKQEAWQQLTYLIYRIIEQLTLKEKENHLSTADESNLCKPSTTLQFLLIVSLPAFRTSVVRLKYIVFTASSEHMDMSPRECDYYLHVFV